MFVGSASGTTTVAGLSAVLASNEGGNVQIGYHGAGGATSTSCMNDGLGLIASSPTDATPFYAMIGNGALDGSVSGAVTGNIDIRLGGQLILATGFVNCNCDAAGGGDCAQNGGNGRTIGIGNAAGGDTTRDRQCRPDRHRCIDDATTRTAASARIIFGDLGYGDVTVGMPRHRESARDRRSASTPARTA